MARTNFDESTDYHGGRVLPEAVKRLRYPCFATDCPMPGAIFTNGVDKVGTCNWHYGLTGADVPKVTNALRAWDCVAYEVRAARRTLTDPDIATNPAAIAERFATAWERLQPLVAGAWEPKLKPQIHEPYGNWAKRLEAFIGGQVVEAIGMRAPRRPTSSARAHAFAEGIGA